MKALFFSPHQLVLPHSIPEIIALRSFIENGNSVSILGCRGALERRCTTQDARGIYEHGPADSKSDLCKKCIKAQEQVKAIPGIDSTFDIEDLITEADILQANKLLMASSHDLINLKINGVPIGRLALYETVLTFKLVSKRLSVESEKYYRDLLYGSVLLSYASRRLISAESFDFLMLHNSLYCHNQTISQNLHSSKTRTISFHCGLNFAYRENRLIIAKDNFKKFVTLLMDDLKNAYSQKIDEEIFDKILEHIKISSGGGSVFAYSSPMQNESVLEKLGINENSKVILAVLSSADELIAAKEAGYLSTQNSPDLFVNQFAWIRWLFSWAEINKNRTLIIRIHPREAPNRREKFISESMNTFEGLLESMPKNVRINWPDDNLSMYDFVPHVECVLTSWSSAGKEFAVLGIPVISYANQNRSYPDDIHAVASSLDEYLYLLDYEYIKHSFDRSNQIIKSLKWLQFEQFSCSLDLMFVKALKVTSNSILSRALTKIKKLFNGFLGGEEKIYPYDLIDSAIKQKIPQNFLDNFKLILEDAQNKHFIIPENGKTSRRFLSNNECIKLMDKFLSSYFFNKK